MQEIIKKLSEIQQKIKVKKNNYSKYGGYYYRSADDIYENVKPLLGEAVIIVTDDIINIGDRFYVKATARFLYKDQEISVNAFAREINERKKMDGAQITGSSSSYARKYALQGLLSLDDGQDMDTADNDKEKFDNVKNKFNGKEIKESQDFLLIKSKMVENENDFDKIRALVSAVHKKQFGSRQLKLSKVESETLLAWLHERMKNDRI